MYLALKEIKYNKWKYFAIVLIIALISWLIFLSSSLAEGLSDGNKEEIERWDVQTIYLDEAANNNLSASFINEKEPTDDNLARVSSKLTTLRSNDVESMNVAIIGYDKGSFIEPNLEDGDLISSDDEIILSSQLKSDGFEIGDMIELNGEDRLKIVGFSDKSSLNLSPVVYLENDQYQLMTFEAINDIVNGLVSKDDTFDLTIQEFINDLPGYTAQNLTLNTIIYFLFAISTAVIGIFMYIITIQKTSLFGVLKAQGVQTQYLGFSVVTQTIIITLLGLFVGLSLTLVLSLFLPDAVPYVVSAPKITLYSFVLLLVSLLGSVFSVVSVGNIDATTAIG